MIIQRSVELGQTVAASLQSPTIFTIADDLRRMEIAVSIDETDVGRVKPGQSVTFSVSAYPGREFEGKVKHVRLGHRPSPMWSPTRESFRSKIQKWNCSRE